MGFSAQVNGSVRCLTWVDGERMLVGTLDGGIHWWGMGESQPHPLIQQQGSIIRMQFDRECKVKGVGQGDMDAHAGFSQDFFFFYKKSHTHLFLLQLEAHGRTQ